MIDWIELSPFIVLALAGALHCVGMCGGFAVAVTESAAGRPATQWTRMASYVVGKSISYSLLGFCAASAGALAADAGAQALRGEGLDALARSRSVVAWMAGFALIVSGFSVWGWPRSGVLSLPLPLRGMRRTLALVRGLPGSTGAFGTGLLNGLLPCGLSWSALLLAVPGPPATALVGLFVFGLATAPALFGASRGWLLLPLRWRVVAARAAGPLLILLGAFTLARASPELVPAPLARVLPECCRGSDAAESNSPPRATAPAPAPR